MRFASRFWIAGLLLLTPVEGFASRAVLSLERIASGLRNPLAIVSSPDDSGRLFIVQQNGIVRIWRNGSLVLTPFLDLSDKVSCCGERGLLGLAFHPSFATNGRFFVDYTDRGGDTVVARYSLSTNPDIGDHGSGVTLLHIAQPFANHNGGQLQFGPDGYLYVGMGDGGSAGDPGNRAQDLTTLLGKILRLDVDRGSPYAIPPDNPFVGNSNARPEIWARGMRNPWRFSFDRLNGDLWIADVGQGDFEEIDLEPAGSGGGKNYGWRVMEGRHCFNPSNGCDQRGLTLPLFEYDHSAGCSVTGGYRYRGFRSAEMRGTYLFGDFCSGVIFGGFEDSAGGWTFKTLLSSGLAISTFGEDRSGELYLADYGGGDIYRIVDLGANRRRPVRR